MSTRKGMGSLPTPIARSGSSRHRWTAGPAESTGHFTAGRGRRQRAVDQESDIEGEHSAGRYRPPRSAQAEAGPPASERAPADESRALLEACLSADLRARGAAYQRLGERLRRMLWPRVSADPRLEHLAQDCAQEALIKVHRQLSAGKGPDDPDRFLAWAARIAANGLIDQLRQLDGAGAAADPGRTRRVGLSRQVSLDEPRDAGGDRALGDVLADPAAPPDEAAVAREELMRLLAGIRKVRSVSERSRVVLLRGYLQDRTDDELAELLATTRSNVHVIRCRDLEKLRGDEAFMTALRRWRDSLP